MRLCSTTLGASIRKIMPNQGRWIISHLYLLFALGATLRPSLGECAHWKKCGQRLSSIKRSVKDSMYILTAVAAF